MRNDLAAVDRCERPAGYRLGRDLASWTTIAALIACSDPTGGNGGNAAASGKASVGGHAGNAARAGTGGGSGGGAGSSAGRTGGSAGQLQTDATASFDGEATLTTDAVWGQSGAILHVSHVVNLKSVEYSLVAKVDGIRCDKQTINVSDPTLLDLTCTIPPGNSARPLPRLILQTRDAANDLHMLPGGTFEVPARECVVPAAPSIGVALPQLCKVDPGSSALGSSGIEGLWSQPVGTTRPKGFYIFASDGTFAGLASVFNITGKWEIHMTNSDLVHDSWTVTEFESRYASLIQPEELTHDFVPYVAISSLGAMGNYSVANALAVTPSMLAGSWTNDDDITLNITVSGDTGTITGTTANAEEGYCNLTGTIRLHDPNGVKNVFDITLLGTKSITGVSAMYCDLDVPMSGLAAIDFVNVGTEASPVYAYALAIAALNPDPIREAEFFDSVIKQ
jgi:hypothetical protein